MKLDKLNVLLLDDVASIRTVLAEMLLVYGFGQVFTGKNGAEGKRVLETKPVDLVIADLHMEPISGLDLLKYMKGKPQYQPILYVMLTADNTKEGVVSSLKSGADGYLLKPLSVEQISNRLLKILKNKGVLS
jgi:two-component system, chemotaxis family, chemotaxis protein CheY